MSSNIDLALAREWFYEFRLPDGRSTRTYIPGDVATIHTARLEMLDAVLGATFKDGLTGITCIDLACHEGFFAVHVASKGARDVLGIDARPENISGAELMRDIYGLTNMRLEVGDVLQLDPATVGQFDIVLVLGLLYHLSDPVRVLQIARRLTRKVCLVETQLGPNVTGVIDWGSHRYPKAIVGSFSLVDETSEVDSANREANTMSISLVPSLEALTTVMKAVGFSSVDVVKPPAGGNEQFTSRKRVLVKAYPNT